MLRVLMSTDFIFYFSGANVLTQHNRETTPSCHMNAHHIVHSHSGCPFNKGLEKPESDRGGWTYWSHKLYRSIRMP